MCLCLCVCSVLFSYLQPSECYLCVCVCVLSEPGEPSGSPTARCSMPLKYLPSSITCSSRPNSSSITHVFLLLCWSH
uniref:Secreted protein n=1 Tax=Arundo donax TaxID=35708 RepID=A0A0A9F6S1_ARUDO